MAKKINKENALCIGEGVMLLALSVIFASIKIFKLPMGGEVTLFSMLPISIHTYRWFNHNGFTKLISILVAVVFGIVQILFSLGNVLAVGDTAKIIASIALWYILPYGLFGIFGFLRGKGNKFLASLIACMGILLLGVYIAVMITGTEEMRNEAAHLKWFIIAEVAVLIIFVTLAVIFKDRIHQSGFGIVSIQACAFVCMAVIRTICFIIINDNISLTYSIGYNLSYILPEGLLCTVVSVAACALIDMDADAMNVRMKNKKFIEDKKD